MVSFRQCILVFTACLFSCAGVSVGKGDAAREREALRNSELLFQSRNWTDRLRAVETLTGKGADIVHFFSDAARDPHERVRIGAIRGLSSIHDSVSFRRILEIAQNEKEPNARWEAYRCLSLFRRLEAAPVFMSAANDPDWLMRETALAGLLDIDDEKTKMESLSLAVDSLSDPNENVRAAVLLHLTLTDLRVYAYISKQLSGGAYYRKPGYLKILLTALAKYKLDKDMRNAVLEYFTHPDPQVRVLALQVIKNSDAR